MLLLLRALWKIDVYLISTLVNKSLLKHVCIISISNKVILYSQ